MTDTQYDGMTADQLQTQGQSALKELPTGTQERMSALFDEVITYAKVGPKEGVTGTQLRSRVQNELAALPHDQVGTVRPIFDAAIAKGDSWEASPR